MARNLTEYYTPEVIKHTEQPHPKESPYMSLTEMENDPIAMHKVHTNFTE